MRTVRAATAVAALAVGAIAWTPYDASGLAAQSVDIGGQPIVGSTDQRVPTALDPGLWAVTLGPDAQHFSYARQIKDSTIHVGVVAAPTSSDGDSLQVAATVTTDESGEIDCGTGDDSTSSAVPHGIIGAHAVVGDETDTDDCRAADVVAIEVGRYSGSATADLPVAIKVVEEAPVTDGGEGPPESEDLEYDVPDPVDPVSAPAGEPSFDDAPLVDVQGGPVTIATEVTEGDEVLWRLPVGWGDQPVVRADLPAVSEAEAERLGYPNVAVRLRIIQPSRDSVALTESDDYAEDTYGDTEASRLVAGTYPLRYANRYDDEDPTLPGDYWVALAVAPTPEDREPLDVPVELTLAVTGTDAAPPTYQGAVLAQGGGAGPDGYSADTPFLVGDGEFAAVASGSPFAPDDDADDWWGPRRAAGVGLGVVSLACCVVGATWLVRRRAR